MTVLDFKEQNKINIHKSYQYKYLNKWGKRTALPYRKKIMNKCRRKQDNRKAPLREDQGNNYCKQDPLMDAKNSGRKFD